MSIVKGCETRIDLDSCGTLEHIDIHLVTSACFSMRIIDFIDS